MFVLSAHIKIGIWSFNSPSEITITEDTDTLIDICDIIIPKRIKWEGLAADQANLPVKKGDKVAVSLGYDGSLTPVFKGYVRAVDFKTPMKISCEDEMFLMKNTSVKKRTVTGSIGKIIKALVPADTQVIIPEASAYIGAHRFVADTVAKEFLELKKDYGLKIFYKQSKLYVCWLVPWEARNKARFIWGKNIIEDGLTHTNKDDIKIKIKATSVLKNNKRVHLEYGDKGGEERSVYAYNLSKPQLLDYVQHQMKKYKQTKYEGSLTLFGNPVIHKLDVIEIASSDGGKGAYVVHKVVRNFGAKGYRQQIELGYKV